MARGARAPREGRAGVSGVGWAAGAEDLEDTCVPRLSPHVSRRAPLPSMVTRRPAPFLGVSVVHSAECKAPDTRETNPRSVLCCSLEGSGLACVAAGGTPSRRPTGVPPVGRLDGPAPAPLRCERLDAMAPLALDV